MYNVKKTVNLKVLAVIGLIMYGIPCLFSLPFGVPLLVYGIFFVIIFISMSVVYLGEKYL
jgi:hypothetical protein